MAVSLIILKTGKKVRAAIRQPARMIGLRPMRSERLPKNRKPAVPRASDQATRTLAVKLSIFEMFCRKNVTARLPPPYEVGGFRLTHCRYGRR